MGKIITAICGIFIAGVAFGAAPGNYAQPKKNNIFTSAAEWKVVGKFEKTLYPSTGQTDLYNGISTEMCYHETRQWDCDVKAGMGTYDDEKAVVLHIAKKIYKYGAEFCTIQVQPGNANGRQWVWLDYYHNPSMHSCYTYCKPGYDPDNECKPIPSNATPPCDTEYTFPFTTREMITSGGRKNYRITTDMVVFSYANETGAGESNQPAGNQTTKHRVLGILEKIDNGVVVAPMEITGWRTKTGLDGIESWIYDVTTNGNKTTLCAPGYEVQNGNCVISQQCKAQQEAAENAAKPWCSEYENDYDSTKHTLQFNTSRNCKYYKCTKYNYAFKENSPHNCVFCSAWAKGGILNDVCKECGTGQFFKEREGCVSAPGRYTHKQLEQGKDEGVDKRCWLKLDPEEYKSCLACPLGQYYDEVTKGCVQKQNSSK